MIELICRWYCRHFHGAIMLPIRNQYACRKCLRLFDADI